MARVISKEELLLGKAYQRGANLYPTTMDLVEPFFENVQDYVTDYRIEVVQPQDIAVEVTEDETSQEVEKFDIYSRVLIEATLKDEYQFNLNVSDKYTKTIGMLYALDLQQPVAKVYSGYLRMACTNLSIFNPSGMVTKHFTDTDFKNIYNNVPVFINRIDEEKQMYADALEFMNNTIYTKEQLKEILGHLAIQCLAKNNGLNTAYSNMVRMLYSNNDINGVKNIYYKKNQEYTPYDLYQTLTSTVSAKADIIKRPDLTYKAYTLFKN